MVAFLGPLLGGLGAGLASAIFGGGGGSASGYNPLAALLAGQLTSQRIPGQTQPGSYTPQPGGFGTYNYIPTGAETIDPALIWQIMNLGAMNGNAQDHGGWHNQNLLGMSANNPYTAGMQQWAGRAGDEAVKTGAMTGAMQDWLNGQALPIFGAGQGALANYQTLLDQSRSNPYASPMISGAGSIGQGLTQAGSGIQGTALGALSGAEQAAQQAVANPYAGAAQAGANTAGGMMTGAGQDQFNLGRTFTGQVASGLPAISSVLNTAFDPQQQLYDRTLGNVMDQIGTVMARTGTTDSGTGLRFAGDTLRDFNIDWQNNQLGRQTQGLNAYTAGMAGAGSQLGTGTNLQTTGAQNVAAGGAMPYQTYRGIQTGNLDTLGQLADLARTTAGTTGATGQLQLGGNAAGYDAYMQNLLGQQGMADSVMSGVNNLSNIYGGLGTAAMNNYNLGVGATNAFNAAGQLPYGAYMQSYGDRSAGLSNFLTNAAGLSNLSTATIGPMQNYLGGVMQGAGNAANAASGAQTATTNQNAQAAAGLTPLIGGGLNWLSNLVGNQNPWSWAGSTFTSPTTNTAPYPNWAMA